MQITPTTEQTITPIGIIGGGFGGLITYITLRFRGVKAHDIRIFSPTSSPEESWAAMARRIHQRGMRSESVAHFLPTDSPGLATLEALRTWSLKPLLLSWFDRYHPSIETILEQARLVARLTCFWHSHVPAMISRIERKPGYFRLYDDQNNVCGNVAHLILAIGHSKPLMPAIIQDYLNQHPNDDQIYHAFSKKSYNPHGVTLVLGDGLTSATEWMNILEIGGTVVAVSQKGFFFGQPLNTPRRYFSKRGIKPFQSQPADARLQELQAATRGTVPSYRYWNKMFGESAAMGKLRLIHGDLIHITTSIDGRLQCTIRQPDGHSLQSVFVDTILVATGFMPVTTHPLIRQLVMDYDLPLIGNYLKVENNGQIAYISQPGSTASVIGPAAAWAIPSADSLGGMKITARWIGESILGKETWQLREILQKSWQWLTLMRGRELI